MRDNLIKIACAATLLAHCVCLASCGGYVRRDPPRAMEYRDDVQRKPNVYRLPSWQVQPRADREA